MKIAERWKWQCRGVAVMVLLPLAPAPAVALDLQVSPPLVNEVVGQLVGPAEGPTVRVTLPGVRVPRAEVAAQLPMSVLGDGLDAGLPVPALRDRDDGGAAGLSAHGPAVMPFTAPSHDDEDWRRQLRRIEQENVSADRSAVRYPRSNRTVPARPILGADDRAVRHDGDAMQRTVVIGHKLVNLGETDRVEDVLP